MFKDERMNEEPRYWISKGYEKGYKEGFNDAIVLFKKGFNDGIELVKKGFNDVEKEEIK